MNLNVMTKDVHNYAKEKGWWATPRTDEDVIMLMITEVAEATECVRSSEPHHHYGKNPEPVDETMKKGKHELFILPTMVDRFRLDKQMKPEGEAVELADCQIRIADFFGYCGWSLETESKFARTIVPERDFAKMRIPRSNPLQLHLRICELLTDAGKSARESDDKEVARMLAATFNLITDIFTARGWKWEEIVQEKMAYNQKRPYRHGGKAY